VNPQSLDGVSVLLVDDADDARDVMAELLETFGAKVYSAATVSAAIKILDKELPRILISDIGMPTEDGFSLIRKLRSDERTRAIPAIALTGYADSEIQIDMAAVGFQAHLVKPVDVTTLVDMIQRLLA
jgi:CheY-like chemotaxis protein